MKVSLDNIPSELASLKQWVGWKFGQRNGKKTKIPRRIDKANTFASSTDPSHWGCMTQALQRMQDDKLDGIGFVFNGQGILGIDLDDCIKDGVVEEWAQAIVDTMASYTEITPSGKGLHILLRASLPGKGRRKGAIEVYASERYFTVTGHQLEGSVNTITEPAPGSFDAWFTDLFVEPELTGAQRPVAGKGHTGDDSELIVQASTSKNGAKFGKLWQGNVSDYDNDQSRADQALCMMLAFWTAGDEARIDRLFRQSGLYRPKWDAGRGDHTYGHNTIKKAVEVCSEFYEPDAYETDVEFQTVLDRLYGTVEKETTVKVKSRPFVANYITKRKDKDSEPKTFFSEPNIMLAQLIEGTDGWPKRVGGVLFALSASHDDTTIASSDDIVYLKTQDDFYAWCQGQVSLSFTAKKTVLHENRAVNPVTRGEFYRIVQQGVDQFDSIELLPHTPHLEKSFYFPTVLPKPTGKAIQELLSVLNAETENDRSLMLAALLTPGWGGPPGARPAFVFTSEHGRGSGKTMTADFFSQIWGGCLSVQESEPLEGVRSRLLDESSLSTRIVLIDNLKSRLSNGSLESMITASNIDGKRMYVGQATRPNNLTWYITANNPDLSRDLAERSIQIKVGQPKHDIDFRTWSIQFMKESRLQLLSDLLHLLTQKSKYKIDKKNADRWLTWQTQVLSKIPNANTLAEVAIQTREAMDSDVGTASDIHRVIQNYIKSKGFLTSDCMLIDPKEVHEALVKDGQRKAADRQQSTTAFIKHYLDVPPLKGVLGYRQVRKNEGKSRFFLWRGNNETPDTYTSWPLLGEQEEQDLEY